ncbi:hypothetical protein, partial [Empedobacter brevis]|uniref:hypothetical protein n=1 Tax=Empedobacter brevis TaxID=247 RepID=UPI0039AF1AA2
NTPFSEELSKDTRTTLEETLFLILSFLHQTHLNKGKVTFYVFFLFSAIFVKNGLLWSKIVFNGHLTPSI